MARERRRGGGCAALLVIGTLAALVAGALIFGPGLAERYGDRLFSQSECTVTLDDDEHTLTAEQANNAALIAAGSARRGLAARAATIAIATAIQESSLRNITYGDRDSLGLFQQRPSQGWGTEEDIMDPYYSTDKFYEGLVLVIGWRDMPVTEAAQTVQRSAFPDAYGDHEPEARLWASALRGHSGPMAVTCDLGDAEPTTVAEFAARVDADFGEGAYTVEELSEADGRTLVAVTPASDSDHEANAMAAWAVAVASEESVYSVSVDGEGWSRDEAELESGPDAPDGIQVALVTAD